MLDPDRLSFEFEAGADKQRLDEFVATRLPKISLTRIRRLIAEGDVLLNNEKSLKGVRLQPGDRVSVKIFAADKSSTTPEPIPLDILFEHGEIRSADERAGLPLLADRRRADPPRPGSPPRSQHFWSDGHRQDAARAPHSLETFPRAPGEEVLPGAPQRARGK